MIGLGKMDRRCLFFLHVCIFHVSFPPCFLFFFLIYLPLSFIFVIVAQNTTRRIVDFSISSLYKKQISKTFCDREFQNHVKGTVVFESVILFCVHFKISKLSPKSGLICRLLYHL